MDDPLNPKPGERNGRYADAVADFYNNVGELMRIGFEEKHLLQMVTAAVNTENVLQGLRQKFVESLDAWPRSEKLKFERKEKGANKDE